MTDAATARAAGRGGLAIAGAKAAFIAFGFAQTAILPWLLGPIGYGQARAVLSVVSIVNNAIVAISIQGVSRAVSSAPAGKEDEAFRATLRVHVTLAMIVSLGFALASGAIAGFIEAPHLTAPLRLVAAVVLLYGLYAPLVGSLNGRRRFTTQAALDTGYGAMRTVLLAGGAVLFLRAGASGVMGAFSGFVLAAAVIIPFALSRAGIGKRGEGGPSVREYLSFLLPVAGGQVLLNLLMQTDALLLRRFLGQAAPAKEVADTFQGIYGGAQQFSFLPYQLLMSVTFILFPLLARADADGDRDAVKRYTMAGVRLAMMLTAIITGTVAGVAPHLLHFLFPKEMWPGGEVLRILCIGMGAFSVLGVTCAALTSLGRAVDSALLTLTGVVLIAGGCVVMVPRAELGLPMLLASATATTAALTVTAIAGGLRLRAVAGGFATPLTVGRSLLALTACVVVGSRLPWMGKPATVIQAALVGIIGLAVLVGTGEIGKQDLLRIKQVAGKKG